MNLLESFNNAGAGILLIAVERLSREIKETGSFRYFSVDDTEMIADYKDFECTMIASALTTIALNLDLKESSQKKDIQTVYIGKSANFLRKIISKEYKLPELELNQGKADFLFKGKMESLVCSQVHVKFENCLADIKKALQSKSPFYFLQYDQPHINDSTGEREYGEERLYNFVWKTLLAKETVDFDDNENDRPCIGVKMYFDLSERENQLLFSFVNDIQKIDTSLINLNNLT